MSDDPKTLRRRKRAQAPGKAADDAKTPMTNNAIDRNKRHHNGRRIRRGDLGKVYS